MDSKHRIRMAGIVFLVLSFLTFAYASGFLPTEGAIVNTASLSVTPQSGTAPLLVSATLCKGTGSWTAPFSFSIGWGDGTQSSSSSSSTCASFDHTYTSSGSMILGGDVSDNYGHSASASASVSVAAPTTTSSTTSTKSTSSTSKTTTTISTTTTTSTSLAPFTVSIVSGPESTPLTWNFIATTNAPTGTPYTCSWSFGSTACTTSYTFSSAGTYTISVTAVDVNTGQTASASQTISVTASTSTSTTSTTSTTTTSTATSTTVTTANLAVACTLNGQAAYSTTTLTTTTSNIAASCTVTSGQSLVNAMQFVVIDSSGNRQNFTMTQSGSTYTYSYTLPTQGTYTIQANAIESSSTVNLFSVTVPPNSPSQPSVNLKDVSYFFGIIGVLFLAFSYRREMGI